MPNRKVEFDDGNPEWTDEDFARSKPASELPDHIRKAFPRTRGPQKAPVKVPVSIRLGPEVVEHYKATGKGWQARIDTDLKKLTGL